MIRKYLLALVFVVFCCSSVFSQSYFGETTPGMTPKIFAKNFISSDEFEFGGMFTPDGKEYFFTRRPTYEGAENRIFHTKLVNGKWTEPILAAFAQNAFEFEPFITPDGEKIYFYSTRKDNRDNRFDGDLWISQKTENGWSEAEYFISTVNKEYCMGVTASENGTLFFTAAHNDKRGVFYAENQLGKYPEVKFMPAEINSNYYSHPFIASDESYIIMDGQPTGRGKSELFVSFRKKDKSWTTPVNMGKLINATLTEFGASVSPDGKYLFFHRRVGGNGDIYWVDAKIIETLKPKDL